MAAPTDFTVVLSNDTHENYVGTFQISDLCGALRVVTTDGRTIHFSPSGWSALVHKST